MAYRSATVRSHEEKNEKKNYIITIYRLHSIIKKIYICKREKEFEGLNKKNLKLDISIFRVKIKINKLQHNHQQNIPINSP